MKGDNLFGDETLDSIFDIKVIQNKRGYRFSIDALLLASFALPLKESERVLDIGTGSGIIPLILARMTGNALFWAIEIQESLYKLAMRNISLNSLSDRITLLKGDFKDILIKDVRPGEFTLVISNPPYRERGKYRVSPYSEKAVANYEVDWGMEEFIMLSSRAIGRTGRICFVQHISRFLALAIFIKERGLNINRLRFVYPKRGSDAILFLIEIEKIEKALRIETPIFLDELDEGIDTLFAPLESPAIQGQR